MARNTEAIITHGITAVASTVIASPAIQVERYTGSLVVLADLAGIAGTSTADVWIEESYDGTNWYEVGHFPQLAGGAAAISYRVVTVLGAAAAVVVVKDPLVPAAAGVLVANTFLAGPWGPKLRIVSRTSAGVPSGGTVNQTIRFEQFQAIDGR